MAGGTGPGSAPAAAELGQGQVGGEFPATEPHRAAGAATVTGQGDHVPGDLPGVTGAEPLADQHPGLAETGEELLLAARASGGNADRPPQGDPGRLLPLVAAGLLAFSAGGTAGCSPVRWGSAPQPVPFFGCPARFPDAVTLVRQTGLAAVLAGQHRHDVDVVRAVPDGDPADRVILLTPR